MLNRSSLGAGVPEGVTVGEAVSVAGVGLVMSSDGVAIGSVVGATGSAGNTEALKLWSAAGKVGAVASTAGVATGAAAGSAEGAAAVLVFSV